MPTIVINGVTISAGRSISIKSGRVTIDGEDVTPDGKEINISIEGNIDRLEADACEKISVKGNINSVGTVSGDVDVEGDVRGSVSTMSGDVDCGGGIGGSVSTMSGNVKHRK
tara:strand:- start:65297 stop:65632 length:336 start_codon:yes stop_codon:yes gene_type:complete